ncbi:MAG: SH3 domain-containing protein [Elusimicrobiota bacterium]
MHRVLAVLLTLTPLAGAADFVCVKNNKINVREGPGQDRKTLWQVVRYMPLEIVKKQGDWYQVKDFEGDTGWVSAPLVEAGSCLVVKANSANVRSGPSVKDKKAWLVKKRYTFALLENKKDWLKVKSGEGFEGWISKNLVWGASDAKPAEATGAEGKKAVTLTSACSTEDCFKDYFKQCKEASVTKTVSGSMVYRYDIVGPKDNACNVKMTYLSNPNTAWVDKQMQCLYDNTQDFEMAIKDMARCQGELYDLMTSGTSAVTDDQKTSQKETEYIGEAPAAGGESTQTK